MLHIMLRHDARHQHALATMLARRLRADAGATVTLVPVPAPMTTACRRDG